MKFLSERRSRRRRKTATGDARGVDWQKVLEAKRPTADDAYAAEDDVENEQLRCGRSTQYPRSVSAIAKREYRNCTFHTQ